MKRGEGIFVTDIAKLAFPIMRRIMKVMVSGGVTFCLSLMMVMVKDMMKIMTQNRYGKEQR